MRNGVKSGAKQVRKMLSEIDEVAHELRGLELETRAEFLESLRDAAEAMLEETEAREDVFKDLADAAETMSMDDTRALAEEQRIYREERPRAAAIGCGEAGAREFSVWQRAFRTDRRERLAELIRRIRS